MDVTAYMPEPLSSFRELVEADLRRGARLVVKVQDEIDPQLRPACPDGDYHVAVTLPKDDFERRAMLRRLSTLMVWKQAAAFTLTSELIESDCVYCMGVSRSEVLGCLSLIRRHPRPWSGTNFAPIQWLDRRQIGQELIDLLPAGPRPLTPKDVSMLDKWFGVRGTFPLVHLPSKEVRGV